MFGLFSSVETRARDTARHWIETAEKIDAYRSDQLSESERTALTQGTEKLRALVKEKADASRLKLATESLEAVLRQTGGSFYPRSSLQEYVEFFVVAAIVVFGLRAYFFQPFKIPTNSMWPTYNGMTPEVYPKSEDTPNFAEKAARLVLFGASHYEVIAPRSGRVFIPVYRTEGGGAMVYTERKEARKWGLFPSRVAELTFSIEGNQPVSLRTPEDFDFQWLIKDAFGLDGSSLEAAAVKSKIQSGPITWVELPVRAVQGKSFLTFDILTGDQLFVDRLSYHFVRPEVGSAFVFRTGNIAGLGGDQYYIKRLAGVPGDVLEIKEPALFRNGAPITGAQAFADNNKKAGSYGGYFNSKSAVIAPFLLKGDQVEIPAHRYFALGDNSGNSRDSRYWGFVPYKDVIGRPLFIYYPFSRHWGVAK